MTEFFAHSVKLRLSGCDDLIPWVEVLPSSTGRDHMEANPAWAAPTSFSGTTVQRQLLVDFILSQQVDDLMLNSRLSQHGSAGDGPDRSGGSRT